MKRWPKSVAGIDVMEECFPGFTPTTYRQKFLITKSR